MDFLLFISIIAILYLLIKYAKARKRSAQIEKELSTLNEQHQQANSRIATLEKFQACVDAEAEAARIVEEAKAYRKDVAAKIDEKKSEVESVLSAATKQRDAIIADAKLKAEEIAGDAYRALSQVDALKSTALAMENVIEGYGFKYLKPTYSILDEIADLYSFDEAGQQLKLARSRTKKMVEDNLAGSCEYVKDGRKNLAIMFVIDAFNGKVDSILTRVKTDNYGILEQQIKDAFHIVNQNGKAFRDARITDEYLSARLEELRWAVAITALKEKEKAEQKAIRDQIREEEKARREIEKALKDAAKEEEAIQKALAKLEQQLMSASDAQKAKYEAQLAELQQKYLEAELRSQRAKSMAQQTRSGHVYIISNIGSFGENVYKIGMTRRLDPLDRVKELGDASVPFSFDVHAMIWSNDAPKLENDLHKEFIKQQINKVNPRKEFFKVGIHELKQAIESRGIDAAWTLAASAAEYKESLAIEKQLIENPQAEQAWMKSQLEAEVDTLAILNEEAIEETA